jgi:hypothetical protein
VVLNWGPVYCQYVHVMQGCVLFRQSNGTYRSASHGLFSGVVGYVLGTSNELGKVVRPVPGDWGCFGGLWGAVHCSYHSIIISRK